MISKLKDRLLPVLFFVLGGCAGIPEEIRELEPDDAFVELTETPFYPQQRYQCGPAALMTALEASGAQVSLQELVDKVYLPGRAGSLQLEMLAATRTSGRVPYRLDRSLSALMDELEANRPVVVLQNLGVAVFPRWHFATVVGIDPENDLVVLRSGVDKRRLTKTRTFLHTWRRSDYWAFVTLRPDELPANIDRSRYFASIAGLEQAGRAQEAAIAWMTALTQWPDEPVVLFGLANAYYALQNWQKAEQTYRRLLEAGNNLPVARNNLAMVLARQGKPTEALLQLEQAIQDSSDTELLAEFERTRQSIEKSLNNR